MFEKLHGYFLNTELVASVLGETANPCAEIFEAESLP